MGQDDPKNPDKWDRCDYVRGVGARAWFCRTKPDDKTHTFMFIDAETSKEHLLPNIDFDLLRAHSAAARWDGKRLVYARKLGYGEWDVRWWSPGQKQWTVMKHPDQPVEVDKPSEVSGIRITNAGVFADDIRSTSMASMAGMGPFHSARTGGEWAGDWVFLPTRKELLGFNVKTKKWLSWDIQRDVHRGLWAVGDTVVYDEFMLHTPTMTFRRLPPGLNAIWVGPYAVVHKTSCPIGKTCKKVADKGPFKDYAVWKPDVKQLSPKDPKLPRPR